MKRTNTVRNPESGIAMIAALFALLLLTAIAVGMMYMSTSESQVNANFKSSQRAFWGARAGLEEVRARLYTGKVGSGDLVALAPTALPGNANSLLYVSRPLAGTDPKPWEVDTEICREFSFGAAALNCELPNPAWVTPAGAVVTSYTPLENSAAPPFEWVRVNLKRNDSNISGATSYLVEQGGAVDRPICWTGTAQVVMPAAAGTCGNVNLTPRMNPVYVLEAYAVAPGGAGRYA